MDALKATPAEQTPLPSRAPISPATFVPWLKVKGKVNGNLKHVLYNEVKESKLFQTLVIILVRRLLAWHSFAQSDHLGSYPTEETSDIITCHIISIFRHTLE